MGQLPLHSIQVRQTRRSPLTIGIRPAVGKGPTTLAAFDDALRHAGISNFNLVRLSSVIPPSATVIKVHDDHVGIIDLTDGNVERLSAHGFSSDLWGDRLYAVWAFQSAELLGQEAWAGVAWVQDPADGRGVFVEHEGPSEAQVREELNASLRSISRTRGLHEFEFNDCVIGTRCEGEPVAALVIAPFSNEPW